VFVLAGAGSDTFLKLFLPPSLTPSLSPSPRAAAKKPSLSPPIYNYIEIYFSLLAGLPDTLLPFCVVSSFLLLLLLLCFFRALASFPHPP